MGFWTRTFGPNPNNIGENRIYGGFFFCNIGHFSGILECKISGIRIFFKSRGFRDGDHEKSHSGAKCRFKYRSLPNWPSIRIAPVFWACIVAQFVRGSEKQFQIEVSQIIQFFF